MEKIKVLIDEHRLGYALGKTVSDEIVFLMNGDLIDDKQANAFVLTKEIDCITAEIEETFNNESLLLCLLDDDKLIKTSFINTVLRNNVIEIKGKWFFLDHRIKKMVKYICFEYPELWKDSKISLITERVQSSRAVHFGVTFQSAIEKIKKEKFHKARLYCENIKDFSENGVIAEMLVNISTDKNNLINLEVWQGVKEEHEVYYAHGILNGDGKTFTHFDCAVIDYSITDKEILFEKNQKIKGGGYKKLFRIDGNIDKHYMFELANRFFPLDNLIDEYFKVERV
ncbi:MAG: hypothetical protein LAC69_06790 [Chlorobium sp.]|nr:hypothetical protein [Chlorobium sp.]